MSKQAIVFLTHITSRRIFEHFKRLREETNGLLFAVLCVHNPRPSFRERIERAFRVRTPCIEVDGKIGARLLPNRHAQMQRLGRWYNRGFPDLAYLPALISKRLCEYEYIWIMENDVDYAGDWRQFFDDTMENQADLLTTYAYPRSENRNWCHWSWFETPPEVTFDQHTSSFNPIARFSRRMLAAYLRAVQDGRWQGHTEALWPTIARHNGLTICDLGGTSPFCPEPWRNKHYYNPPVAGWNNYEPGRGDMPKLSSRPFWMLNSDVSEPPTNDITDNAINEVTFIWAPTVQDTYFHENPTRFRRRGVLYHPVKVARP